MLDETAVGALRDLLCDRFTPEELIELLAVSVADVFDAFRDECLDIDFSGLL